MLRGFKVLSKSQGLGKRSANPLTLECTLVVLKQGLYLLSTVWNRISIGPNGFVNRMKWLRLYCSPFWGHEIRFGELV